MAFAFRLAGDDIDLEEGDEDLQESLQEVPSLVANEASVPIRRYFINEAYSGNASTKAFLYCLPSSISFESVNMPVRGPSGNGGSVGRLSRSVSPVSAQDSVVLRRPTYDILLQLKAEADTENHNAELITALETNDRQSGVYEGGLKTWEGALDLARLVNEVDFSGNENGWHILELGAGSAIPSLLGLKRKLANTRQQEVISKRNEFHFTLSDYNDEVLRHSTWANVLLALVQELQYRQIWPSTDDADSIEVNEDLIHACYKLWQEAGITFNFISGPWGKDFEDAIIMASQPEPANLLILASETIYDLKSLPVFTGTLISLLRRHGKHAKAWVAAKKLYFGVGGGVDAFVREVVARGGLVTEIMNIKQGVSRVVLEVTVSQLNPA